MFRTILTIAGLSVKNHTFWHKLGTNLAHNWRVLSENLTGGCQIGQLSLKKVVDNEGMVCILKKRKIELIER